jgi:hypothetical protein
MPLQVTSKAFDFFWTKLPPHCLSNSEYISRLSACVAYLSQCTEDGFKDMDERIKETIKKSDEALYRELTQLVVHEKSPETNIQMLELLSELKHMDRIRKMDIHKANIHQHTHETLNVSELLLELKTLNK